MTGITAGERDTVDMREQKNHSTAFPEEIKKTKQREEIFKILTEAAEPVSAVDIHKRMAEGQYAISTVYRALTAFEEKGYVIKSMVTGCDMAYYEWNYGIHKHYAVCLRCRKMIPLTACPFEHAKLEAENGTFLVTGHKLELYGYCGKCQTEGKGDA